MPERTYTGPLPRGRVRTAVRSVAFERGKPVEFSSDESKALGPEWSAPKKTAAPKADDTKPAKGTDTKEP